MSKKEIILLIDVIFWGAQYMVKNIITLFLSLVLIILLVANRASALKDMGYDSYYYDCENRFLKAIGIENLKNNFTNEFDILNSSTEKNKMLIKENRDFNKKIKLRLEQIKSVLGSDTWKEIIGYKNQINEKKISIRTEIIELIDAQGKILELSNYSDKSLLDFMNVMIEAQNLKRDSIEFEKTYLDKINDLIA